MKTKLMAGLSLVAMTAAVSAMTVAHASEGGRPPAKPKACTNPAPQQGCVGGINSSGTGNGVFGEDTTYGVGVQGLNVGAGVGVEGTSTGSGIAVEGLNSGQGDGVVGVTTGSGIGVVASSAGAGPALEALYEGATLGTPAIYAANVSGTPAIQAVTYTNLGYPVAEFYGEYDGAFFDDYGNLFLGGQVYTDGKCLNGCSKTRHVAEYAPRSTEPKIDDEGEGTLRNGTAHVGLDPAFANVIDAHATYLVTLTPEGDCNGLYVTGRTSSGFDVHESHAGRSSIGFAYRIVAKPYGVDQPRLPFRDDIIPARRAASMPAISRATR